MPFGVGLWRAHPTQIRLQLTRFKALSQDAKTLALCRGKQPIWKPTVTDIPLLSL